MDGRATRCDTMFAFSEMLVVLWILGCPIFAHSRLLGVLLI